MAISSKFTRLAGHLLTRPPGKLSSDHDYVPDGHGASRWHWSMKPGASTRRLRVVSRPMPAFTHWVVISSHCACSRAISHRRVQTTCADYPPTHSSTVRSSNSQVTRCRAMPRANAATCFSAGKSVSGPFSICRCWVLTNTSAVVARAPSLPATMPQWSSSSSGPSVISATSNATVG